MNCYLSIGVLLFVIAYCYANVSDLKIETLEQKFDTCQRKVKDGDQVHVHYTGRLLSDGSKFDSSHDRQQPFVFQIGRRQVIPGWEQGLLDMCVGEKRKLTIPSALAYGDAGAGDKIPPNADLDFEVELLQIEDGPPNVNVFKLIDADDDGALSPDEVGNYLKKQIPRDVRESSEMEDFDEDKVVLEIFEHEDKDKNGYISHEEFSGPKHDEL